MALNRFLERASSTPTIKFTSNEIPTVVWLHNTLMRKHIAKMKNVCNMRGLAEFRFRSVEFWPWVRRAFNRVLNENKWPCIQYNVVEIHITCWSLIRSTAQPRHRASRIDTAQRHSTPITHTNTLTQIQCVWYYAWCVPFSRSVFKRVAEWMYTHIHGAYTISSWRANFNGR